MQDGKLAPRTKINAKVIILKNLWLLWENLQKNTINWDGKWQMNECQYREIITLVETVFHAVSGSIPCTLILLQDLEKPNPNGSFWKDHCLRDGFGELWRVLSSSLSVNPKRRSGIWIVVTDPLTVSRDSAASERLRPWAPSSQTI